MFGVFLTAGFVAAELERRRIEAERAARDEAEAAKRAFEASMASIDFIDVESRIVPDAPSLPGPCEEEA